LKVVLKTCDQPRLALRSDEIGSQGQPASRIAYFSELRFRSVSWLGGLSIFIKYHSDEIDISAAFPSRPRIATRSNSNPTTVARAEISPLYSRAAATDFHRLPVRGVSVLWTALHLLHLAACGIWLPSSAIVQKLSAG